MEPNQDILPMRGTFPKAPKHLNAVGKRAWDIGLALWSEGTLRERDLINWKLFSEACQEKEHCETIVRKDGEYLLGPNKCWVQHPAVKRRMAVESVIRKYSLLFGLLPDARKRRPAVAQAVAQRSK